MRLWNTGNSARKTSVVLEKHAILREKTFPLLVSQMTSVLTAGELFASPQLVEHFMYGLALADGSGRLLYLTQRARRLLLPSDAESSGRWGCCDLICSRLAPLLEGGCLSEQALAA